MLKFSFLDELYTHSQLVINLVTYFIKGILHPKMKIVIFHLPPCRSKPVKASLVFRTQFILDENREACDCPIDCQVNYTVKAQKNMKGIVKIVHLPSVVQS